jgi:aquaporin Z
MKLLDRRLLVEFIGTFFWVLTLALSGQAIAVGAVLIGLTYLAYELSGAHFNPAITVAALIERRIDRPRAMKYVLVQVTGSLTAALVYFAVSGQKFVPLTGETVSSVAALIVELLFAMILALVYLIITKRKEIAHLPIAMGFLLTGAIFAAGPISGGVFNPAVALGTILFDIGNLDNNLGNLLIYLAAPTAGGALASLVGRRLQA